MLIILPVTFSLIYKLIQCSAAQYIYQFESWCLQLPITENEDTHPKNSQNKLDGVCLKTCCLKKNSKVMIILLRTDIFSSYQFCKLEGL